jgi:hypothetical protein
MTVRKPFLPALVACFGLALFAASCAKPSTSVTTCCGGQTDCSGQCIDLTGSDPQNCGACGKKCGAGSSCQSGACVCGSGQLSCNNDSPEARIALPYRTQRELSPWLAQAQVVHIHGVWGSILKTAATMAVRLSVPYIVAPHGMVYPWSLKHKRLKKQLGLILG